MRDTRVWVCPAQCGCQIQLTADWVADQAESGGLSYQHPVPFTITTALIVAVCPAHDALRTTPLPADPYGGSPGYVALPLLTPSEALTLYVHLYQYSGQRLKLDTCSCVVYTCINRFSKEESVLSHSKHTRFCGDHLFDDAQHTVALTENRRKNRTIQRILTLRPLLTSDDISWSFESGTRRLVIRAAALTGAERVALQTWADSNLDAGRVVIQ